jgi:hypothetical protein
MAGPLGRRPPTDDLHLRKWSLTAETMPTVPTPVVLGVWWDHSYDRPKRDRDGSWWIGREPLTGIRGGHSFVLKPPKITDLTSWWAYFDQKDEGACVSFACNRMQALNNRKQFDPWPAYRWMQLNDEFSDTPPEGGTSTRAGMDCLRTQGLWRVRAGKTSGPFLSEGISENRWCRSTEELAACLSPADNGASVLNAGYVEMLNSWGKPATMPAGDVWTSDGFPHITRIPIDHVDLIVFRSDGEATLAIDK